MKTVKDIGFYTSAQTCDRYADFADVNIISEKGITYDRAIVLKEIIKNVLTGKNSISEVTELCSQGIEGRYSLDETNKAVNEKEANNIKRYLRCEKRELVFPAKEAVALGFDDLYISIKPDALYMDKNKKEIELIIYRAGAPSINQRTGIKPEKVDKMKEWLKLWVLNKYGYEYGMKNLGLSEGDSFKVISSFYFMKKTTDSSSAVPDNDFFSGCGGNIVSIINDYAYGYSQTSDDVKFKDFVTACDTGIKCTESDCVSCIGRANCKYTKAPVKLQKREIKKRGEVVYSDAQNAIINAVEGIYRVNATAGSGKTECMTERSTRLIANGMDPHKILHISFTDAAVSEMKNRIVGKCLGRNISITVDDIECFTFNAFANRAIGKYYDELGYKKAPAILTPERELDTIEKLIQRNPIPGIDPGSVSFTGNNAIECVILIAQKAFEIIKTKMVDTKSVDALDNMREALREAGHYKKMSDQSILALLDIYSQYNDILKDECLVTYADQEPLMFEVLRLHPEYFDSLGYSHIIVDEFQDSNDIQMATLKRLVNTSNFVSLMVVGDDSQAIYAFRNATPEYMINLSSYLGKEVTNLDLVENRRSTPEICDFANKIIDLNVNKIDKQMIAVRDSGKAVKVKGFYNHKDEYDYLVQCIVDLVKSGVPYEDIAFISYKKTELLEIGNRLSKENIPWVMKNPMNLMENSRVLAAMSIADAFYDPETTIHYFNYLSALYDGELLNKFTSDEINEMILDLKAEFESIYLLEFEDQRRIFHEKLEAIRNVTEDELYDYFLSLLYNNEDLPSELEYTRIFKKYGHKMAKKMDQSYEGVALTTAHSSKGLEWNHVFCSLSNFDSERMHKIRATAEREERRRLLFVAATRARDELTITGEYVAYGPKTDRTFNMFLRDVYSVLEMDYNPIDPMEAIRDAEKLAKNRAKARERYAKKSKSMSDTGSRELTEEEKSEYNKLVAGAVQMDISSFVS